jgi:hypothetical protein
VIRSDKSFGARCVLGDKTGNRTGNALRHGVLAALASLCTACGGGDAYQSFNADSPFFGADETTDTAATFNNPALLDPRVNYTDETIEIEDPEATIDAFGLGVQKSLEADGGDRSAVIQAVESIELTLVAELYPPEVNGVVLQATSIALDGGDKGLVSYNTQGEQRTGAIDWITEFSSNRPRLRSQILFSDTDISAVATQGSVVYAAAATDDPSAMMPAVLHRLRLQNDRFTLRNAVRAQMSSFAATSVLRVGNTVYATSGSAGEVVGFTNNDLAEEGAYALHDARWVAWDKDGKRVVIAQGTPGQLSLFEEEEFSGGTMTLLDSFPFPGADVPEAKTTVDVAGSQAYVAAGTAGVQIVCLDTGEVVGSVPRPDPAGLGLDPSVVVTNAVAVDKDLMFISNGEAGVYVATSENDFEDYACGEGPEITMLGQLQFGDLESVNHIEYENDYLFVAAGLGGVKVVAVDAN